MSTLLINSEAFRIPLADKSVHMVCFSPPYWGLRDYGTARWRGGDESCEHTPLPESQSLIGASSQVANQSVSLVARQNGSRGVCRKCGAVRVDRQLGLERSPDCLGWATGNACGECYVCHVVQYMREVWRVLRDDGTCWLNVGDSFSQTGKWGGKSGNKNYTSDAGGYSRERRDSGLKPKDLVLVPHRLALALQAAGWYVRQDIIWNKPNAMPSSVTDRPSSSHEHVWLLSKSQRYYYDHVAVQELAQVHKGKAGTFRRENGKNTSIVVPGQCASSHRADREDSSNTDKRNKRSVWSVNTESYRGAHYAVFPQKLVEPMILAGTSEKGCCPRCGAQWTRVVKRKKHKSRDMEMQRSQTRSDTGRTDGFVAGPGGRVDQVETLGWESSCKCNCDPVPSRVLDIFAGSGTTLLVARRLGRSAVGCDLSLDYLRNNARERLGLNQLDAWNKGKPKRVTDTISETEEITSPPKQDTLGKRTYTGFNAR